jgi:hypothetical protein
MKKNCERFAGDISAFALDISELSPEAAAHIQNCAACREKIAELKAMAAMHWEGAANLVEPKGHLSRAQLERALASGGQRRREFEIAWRPVLVGGAVALALMVAGVVTHRTHLERADARHQSEPKQRETKVGEQAFEPAILALRHEVEGGGEQMFAGTTGGGLRHYRVKDAANELRN